MKRFLFILILFSFSLQNTHAQQLKSYSYGYAVGKIDSGTLSTQVSIGNYMGAKLQSGAVSTQTGFLSIIANNSTADSLALVDLYQATNPGDTAWNNTDGWLTAPLDQWFGVQLNGQGRVIGIDLSSNNLNGELPVSFRDLTLLENIYMDENPNLSGDILNLIIDKTDLTNLHAGGCDFSGPIPTEIANASNLSVVRLYGNNLSGTIPPEIGQLRKLEILDLNDNLLTGELPTEIGNIDSLKSLFLENYNEGLSFTGEIPSEILNCNNLEEFWFGGNDFSGILPQILNLPNFKALQAGGNSNLLVEIPDNIGELTQLEFFSIWNTRPNGGSFPEGFYNLTNLNGLDLSEQLFTGSIDDRIGNLTNLTSLYLRNNILSGAFPIEITNANNLELIDLSGNSFDFVPDISTMPNLQMVYMTNNNLQYESLLPFANSGLSEFQYNPQKQIGTAQNIDISIGGSQNLSTNIDDNTNAIYQWLLNGDTLNSATSNEITIENFSTAKSGRYVLQSTHPDLPELVLNSAPVNVKIAGGKTNWYVDNRPSSVADFRNLSQAVTATKAGDTIYVAGSSEIYAGAVLNEPKVIIGPGYFLEENNETQFNKQSAALGNVYFNTTADGSQIYGAKINILGLNFQSSSAPDTLKNIIIRGNQVKELIISDKNDQVEIAGNFIKKLEFSSTSAVNVSRSYDNISVHNNIIDTLTTFFDVINEEKNSLSNVIFDFNSIEFVSNSINDIAFGNNILGVEPANNTFNNNITFNTTLFTNGSGNFIVDNDFLPVDNGLPQGPFAGSSPYILSGLPPVPTIYNIEIGSRLSAKVNTKSNNENNIQRIRYLYRRNNQSSTPFNVSGFTPNSDLEVEFLPNRSSIQPNQTYDLILVAIDENGIRSHRTYIPYETLAANLSGNVVDIDNINVNEGNIRLFAINPFSNKYDTAAVETLSGSNTFNFENLILGDYIILADPDETAYPNLIPTYLGNTLDWQIADTIFLQENINDLSIEVEKEPEPLTSPGSEISGVLFEEYEEADSSLRKLPRQRVSGSSVTIRTRSGSLREHSSTLRLIDDGDIVAYTKTDENGEFIIPNLPAGDYKIRVEYPGVEVDETSDINFNLSGQKGEVVSVEAVVEDGKIKVTETGRVTNNNEKKVMTFKFYPNPAKDILHLKLGNSSSPQKLTVLSLNGKIHKEVSIENGKQLVNIHDLPSGMYVLRLEDQNGNYFMAQLIKE